MLIAQVCLQVVEPSAVKVAQPALVRFDVIVLHHVQMQVFGTAACEGTFVTAENDALEVTGQLGATHLYWNNSFL